MKDRIIEAWYQYLDEFNYEGIGCYGEFYKTEAQFLYSIIRLVKPGIVIEMSPDQGFTSIIILSALEKNDIESKLYSFDLHDKSAKYNRDGKVQRQLIVGDVKVTLQDSLIEQADFFFIDCDHSYDFGKWYSEKLKQTKPGILIMIHDWPMYESNGSHDNYIPGVASKKQDIWNMEALAVKENMINTGIASPVLNVTDFLKEIGQEYHDPIYRALSPSQILVINDKTNQSI